MPGGGVDEGAEAAVVVEHNLGEGLAIGSAHARGDVALGTTLVFGFALHNITEGIGIAAPTMQRQPDWRRLLALGAVAGLPTIAGTPLGGLAYSVVLGVLFLAVGLGAIAELVDESAATPGGGPAPPGPARRSRAGIHRSCTPPHS